MPATLEYTPAIHTRQKSTLHGEIRQRNIPMPVVTPAVAPVRVNFTPEVYAVLRKKAEAQFNSVSDVVNAIVEDYCDQVRADPPPPVANAEKESPYSETFHQEMWKDVNAPSSAPPVYVTLRPKDLADLRQTTEEANITIPQWINVIVESFIDNEDDDMTPEEEEYWGNCALEAEKNSTGYVTMEEAWKIINAV